MENKVRYFFNRFSDSKDKVGIWGAIKYVLKRFASKFSSPFSISKINPSEQYWYVAECPFNTTAKKQKNDLITFVMPSLQQGSGGLINVFRFIALLEKRGHHCHINIDDETCFSTSEEARQYICNNFSPILANVSFGRAGMPASAATFATAWKTAYTVRDFLDGGKKYYFIQDFEPFFYPHGTTYVLAENTYRFGFKGVTAGNWLATKLNKQYGMDTEAFCFSYDRNTYYPLQEAKQSQPSVFFYTRPTTPRRAFSLGIQALQQVHRQLSECQFFFAGETLDSFQIPFPHHDLGRLPITSLREIYNSCHVALILSLTNVSLLPLELMACRCAVVSNNGPHVEWLLNESTAMLTEPVPKKLSAAVISLLTDEPKRAALVKSAEEFASDTDWEKEADKISRMLVKDLTNEGRSRNG